MKDELKIDNIRSNLIRQEETIIFALIERAQYAKNNVIYEHNGVRIPKYDGRFLMYLLGETEKIHSRIRRFTAPDEHAFTGNLPEPFITSMSFEWPIKKTKININEKILSIYVSEIIPRICKKNDDKNYGSSGVCDISALQALSKRIHYGKYVAESKYLSDKKGYESIILKRDKEAILKKITNEDVEEKLLKRVVLKASTYGQAPNVKKPDYKVHPKIIKEIYLKFIIPFTKDVECLYLLERLD